MGAECKSTRWERGVSVDDRDRVRARLKRPSRPPLEMIGTEERLDLAVEEDLAAAARERWDATRDERLQERRRRREQLTLGVRLDRALAQLELGRGARARPIASTRR